MSKKLLLLSLFGLGSLFGASKNLEIYWIDAEGGAATLIVSPSGESLLVDTANRTPDDREVRFTDLVRGESHIDCASLSDPVLLREDGTYLYTLPSVVDDIEQTAGLGYDRLGQAVRNLFECLSMGEEGARLSLDGRPLAPDEAPVEAAWVAVDLYPSLTRREAFLQQLPEVPSLQWVHVSAAGIELPTYDRLLAKGICVTTSHVHSSSIAEFVMAGVLDHYQRGPERRADADQRRIRHAPGASHARRA